MGHWPLLVPRENKAAIWCTSAEGGPNPQELSPEKSRFQNSILYLEKFVVARPMTQTERPTTRLPTPDAVLIRIQTVS